MKIYTKKGDKGETSLLGGTRLAKHEARIEAYGSVDELNCQVASLRDQKISSALKKDLIRIQEVLFTIGSHLASDGKKTGIKLPEVKETEVDFLEERIDTMESGLSPLKNFLIPGGHAAVTAAHMARTVCRRAERRVSALGNTRESDAIILKYLNRLSDYFFVLGRKIASDLGVREQLWKG